MVIPGQIKIYLLFAFFILSFLCKIFSKNIPLRFSYYIYLQGLRRIKTKILDGKTYYLKFKKSNEFPTLSIFSFECSSIFAFSIKKTDKYSVFFKKKGFNEKKLTGVPAFDEKYFISCDQIEFYRTLDKDFIAAVQSLFGKGCLNIESNSNSISFTIEKDASLRVDLINELFGFVEKVKKLSNFQRLAISFEKRHILKNLFLESFLYTLFFYIVLSFIEFWLALNIDIYLDPVWMIMQGLCLSAILAAIFIYSICSYFKDSSRVQFFMSSNLYKIVFSFLFLGIFVISDLNIGLDSSPPQIKKVKVLNHVFSKAEEKTLSNQTSSFRRGMQFLSRNSYRITVSDGNKISHIYVGGLTYSSALEKKEIILKIQPGFLKHAWYNLD